jgi:hypothetical protein
MRILRIALLLLLVSCNLNQYGPWLDESGQRLEGSQLIEYPGFKHCGHDKVVFMIFFGDMYAKDDRGVLGELHNAAGDTLTFTVLDEVPLEVEPTGLTAGEREIYFDDATRSDYLYIRQADGRFERWPRAETPCDRPGSGG